MTLKKVCLAVAVAATVLGELCVPVPAKTYTWLGGVNYWETDGAWSLPLWPDGSLDEAIIGSGTVTIKGMGGGWRSVCKLSLGPPARLLIPIWGVQFRTCDTCPKTVTVENNGVIELNDVTAGEYSSLQSMDNIVTLTGSGQIVLAGHGNNVLDDFGWGGSYINDVQHTIHGAGWINARVENRNEILAANGALIINSGKYIDNQAGVFRVNDSASSLNVQGEIAGGWIYPNDGTLILTGGILTNLQMGAGALQVLGDGGDFDGAITFQPGSVVTVNSGVQLTLDNAADGTPSSIVNPGIIRLNGLAGDDNRATLYTYGPASLAGTGRLIMGGDLNNWVASSGSDTPITNGAGHTIEGGGTISNIVNNGKIAANNGTLKTSNTLINNGEFLVTDNATLNIGGSFRSNNLFLPGLATLLVPGWVELTGNFSFAQTDPAKYSWGTGSKLTFSGGGVTQESLEVGGQDLGEVAAGFTGNFNLQELDLAGNGTYLYLADEIDNGHRSPGKPEALYLGSATQLPYLQQWLKVPAGTTLNLNRLQLYVYFNSQSGHMNIYQVKAGDGSKFGGGQIIDVPMFPGRSVPGIITPLLLP